MSLFDRLFGRTSAPLERRVRPTMPTDWDDHGGWDAYHARLLEFPRALDHGHDASGRFAPFLAGKRLQRVWFPGCGLSAGPRLYAWLGFEVLATDVSTAAIAWQGADGDGGISTETLARLALWGGPETRPRPGGTLRARVHDFRTGAPESAAFDAVLNVRALQGLAGSSLDRAARAHFAALRPGGLAIFDTQNVQGERRGRLEDALAAAGFFVPLLGANRWYRAALAATGLPVTMVLGRPIAYGPGSGPEQARLDALLPEYEQRCAEERVATAERAADAETRTATVVYNTG